MWSVLAAAALAAQPDPAGVAEDADFRCLAVVAVVLAETPKQSVEDLRAVTGLTAVFMYYLGRIDVRYPGLDFVAAFKSLDETEGFRSRFASDAERCGNEANQRSQALQDMGRTLQDLPLPVPGAAG